MTGACTKCCHLDIDYHASWPHMMVGTREGPHRCKLYRQMLSEYVNADREDYVIIRPAYCRYYDLFVPPPL